MSGTEISTENSVTRLTHFQSLEAGMFWRSVDKIHKHNIEKNEVLLVQNLKYVDDKIHTVVVRIHPDKIDSVACDTVSFYINDFLRSFKYEPDGEALRKQELQAVQAKISNLQEELLNTQNNPEKLKEKILHEIEGSDFLISNSSLDDIQQQNISTKNLSINISEEDIASNLKIIKNESLIAEAKSRWIIKKTEEISSTINAMTPYFKEQAATAISKTEDVKKYIKKLINGIESLELYVGNNVSINEIKKGESAKAEIPLTIMQRKLVADEELAVFLDINKHFDFRDIELLNETLKKEPEFVKQIFPTERCVLLIATTRRYIDYKDNYYNNVNNYENRKVFLLVRDGENIYQIYSPVETHLQAYHLFPTQKEVGEIFKGIDGQNIQYEDVNLSHHEDLFKSLELHYKRFLLLLCGLDHHHQLFGRFYEGEPSFNFMSLDFQLKYFNFLRDDDDSYAIDSDTKAIHVYEWIKNCNKQLRSGSRVLCINDVLIDSYTAPGAFNQKNSQLVATNNKTDIVIARRKKRDITVTIPASGSYANYSRYNEKREVNLEVTLPRPDDSCAASYRRFSYEKDIKIQEDNYSESAVPYLCLDSICIEELEYYIHDRKSRLLHLNYIFAFKEVIKLLKHEREEQSDIRDEIAYVLDYSISSYKMEDKKKEKIISKVINIWRADHRGLKLPASLTEDDQVFSQIKKLLEAFYCQEYYEQKLRASILDICKNKIPLRLTLNGKGDFYIYTKIPEAEVNDKLIKNVWVNRSLLEFNKEKLCFSFKNYQVFYDKLSKIELDDQIIFEWDESKEFSEGEDFGLTYKGRENIINIVDSSTQIIKNLHSSENTLIRDYFGCRQKLNKDTKRYVENPHYFIPLGAMYNYSEREWFYFGVKINHFEKFLYKALNTADKKEEFLEEFCKIYKNKEYAKSLILESQENSDYKWSSVKINIYNRSQYQGFVNFHEVKFLMQGNFCANTISKKFNLLQKNNAQLFNALHFYANTDVIKVIKQENKINICDFIGGNLFHEDDSLEFIPHNKIEINYSVNDTDFKIISVIKIGDHLNCLEEIRQKTTELKKILKDRFAKDYDSFFVSSNNNFYTNEKEALKDLEEILKKDFKINNEVKMENKFFIKTYLNF